MIQAAIKNYDLEECQNPFKGKLSVKGKSWVMPLINEMRVAALLQQHNIPEIIARIIVSRDLDKGCIDRFLTPKIARDFPDPFKLANMRDASCSLSDAIMSGKKIGIIADFDVDGATSCAVLKNFLDSVTNENNVVPFFIPDRLNDGYGPSVKAFDTLKAQNCEIIVILDSGITSLEPIKYARSIGMEVIVIDHHEPEMTLPDANFIINPKLEECQSGYDYMAAVGITFMFCIAMNVTLRQKGYYNEVTEPSMKPLMDLVALGTVCDMVPLIDANRLFVKYGFHQMATLDNIGLKALLAVSNIKGLPDPYHAGFMLGPRINAGSRVHQSDLGAQLLLAKNDDEAMRLAWLLNDCNEKRKMLQKDMTREAMAKAKEHLINHPQCHSLVIDGQGWHTGLSGLVAGALKDKYNKPACIIAYVETENGNIEGRASGRSIAGVHLANIFIEGQQNGLLEKGGGHAMAGGFTIKPQNVEAFRVFFEEKTVEALREDKDSQNNNILIESCLSVQSLTMQTADLLINALAPFGMGHPEPNIILSDICIDYAEQVGGNHLRCNIRDISGGRAMKAMAFKALETDLGTLLTQSKGTGRALHLHGQVKINEWQGNKTVEFHITDAMEA